MVHYRLFYKIDLVRIVLSYHTFFHMRKIEKRKYNLLLSLFVCGLLGANSVAAQSISRVVDNKGTIATLKWNFVSGSTTDIFNVNNGKVGIGTASPTVTLDVIGWAKVSANLTARSVTVDTLIVNKNSYMPSDIRLKKNVETLTGVLQKIDNLRGVRYEFIDRQKYAAGPQIGVIAQELQREFPELVTKKPDGYLAVNYTQLTAVLIQAIKELQQEVVLLKQTLNSQQTEIDAIRKTVDALLKK